ncbi:MAG: 16S rRNA (uracil(1498)-N(3))-methyltransferase [Alphaproteobacteria bacterium]
MDTERPKARLHVAASLEAGGRVTVSDEQGHYLLNVMRIRAGDGITLFNGRDGEWHAEIEGIARRSCVLRVKRRLREQAVETDLWLLFAPIKRARLDFVAEKAAELGVSLIWPVLTRFTAMGRVNVERLRANAIEAAEQCERLTVPEVREPVPLERALAGWDAGRRLLLLDEAGGGQPIAEAVAAVPEPAALLVGPEGGFAKSELDLLRDLPFVTAASLGPRILRAETAAVAALSCWQALRGDWRRHATPRRGS